MDKTLYELTYLAAPELNQEKREKLSEKIEKLIAAEDGGVQKKEKERLINLNYPISGKTKAFLNVLSFFLTSEKIKNLQNALKEEQTDIIRFIIIKKELRKTLEKKEEKTTTEKKEKSD